MFDEKGDDEQEPQDDAACPPRDGRPAEMYWRFVEELEEQQARGGEERAGKQKAGTQDEGDAVWRALETNESDGGENKSEQAGGDLEISLENGIGLQRDHAQPHGKEEDDKKAGRVRQERRRAVAVGDE